jgi:hypothetical protein
LLIVLEHLQNGTRRHDWITGERLI